ncbi:MAG: lipoyl(octanoyl) transferase LipB [Bacteroidota bacterium]
MNSSPRSIYLRQLGTIPYKAAWNLQEALLQEIVTIKLANRKRPSTQQQPTPGYLLLCNHPHVYTVGTSGLPEHLLVPALTLQQQGIPLHRTNRGGGVTYHGPGQLVIYPILDLDNFFTDLHRYLRLLEEVMIAVLQDFGLQGGRIPGLTGIWLEPTSPMHARKICAIGIRATRWVTMHGLALNVNPDLNYFRPIIPCGVSGKSLTSLENELEALQDMQVVIERLMHHFARLFGVALLSPSEAMPGYTHCAPSG